MSHSMVSTPAIAVSAGVPRLPRVIHFVLDRFLLLPLGALLALLWANTAAESYFRFSQGIAFPVNEIGMVFFLGMVAQEAFEAVMSGGALHAWRYSTLSLAGAVGGIAGAAIAFFIFINLTHELVLADAWPVACAIDVAAAYYVLRLIYPRRHGAVPFLLVMALATDAIALSIAPLQRGEFAIRPGGLALMVITLLMAGGLRRAGVRSFWPYLLGCGTLSWLALYWMGLHPALALVPIVPLLPHRPRSLDMFADRPGNQVRGAEHKWNGIAQLALFFFGLVNAGVILKHYDTGTWAVLVAALIGRPFGIVAALAFAPAAGLRLPRWLTWRDVVVVALATSSGFTFALFMTTVSLPVGAVQAQITLGALSTVVGAVAAGAAAWLLGAGRFAEEASTR